MTGGTLELYMRTLATFHKDGVQKIKEIRASLGTGNYHLYTTYVHALKSASANIGAFDISDFAKELEAAGRRADSAFVELNNTKFLANMKALLNDIGQVLESNKKKCNASVDFELLKSKLGKLEEALVAMDFEAISKVSDDLQKFAQTDGVDASLERILQNVLIGEYDEAILEIKPLLKRDTNAQV
jgi:HPt (histidine-containing phosphotransfer) domain-containing protein